jgi:hypothetical protein
MDRVITLSQLQRKLNLTDEQTVDIAVSQMNMYLSEARFMLAIEKGESSGDIVFVENGESKTTKASSTQSLARSLVKARLDEAKRLAETVIKPSEEERTKHYVGTAHDAHQETHGRGGAEGIKSVFEKSEEPLGNFSSLMPISNTDVVSFIDTAFNYTDSISGLRAEVDLLYTSNKRVNVSGKIMNSEGNIVGKFTRSLNKNGSVNHSEFELNDNEQGNGFGKRFYQNQEKGYIENGYDFISLTANAEVGGYAWARVGFDFADAKTKNSMAESFYEYYNGQYGKSPSLETADAWEIASYRGEDGRLIGKEFMLGTTWEARKDLSLNSMGYQIGQDYYGSK